MLALTEQIFMAPYLAICLMIRNIHRHASQPPRGTPMDAGSGKAIELIVIVAIVMGFYVQQRAALDRLKKTREEPPPSDRETSASDDAKPY
ncbi:hypothetical protein [uncultured Thiocystis sp.]|uniref:hypothetical protein n=1 Tax=uncultured Thiocystis sp. TaxID=1202134 RepID=UPI0025EE7CD6|nr:hypothetical protein [uncultured Thiocystis sp.]